MWGFCHLNSAHRVTALGIQASGTDSYASVFGEDNAWNGVDRRRVSKYSRVVSRMLAIYHPGHSFLSACELVKSKRERYLTERELYVSG